MNETFIDTSAITFRKYRPNEWKDQECAYCTNLFHLLKDRIKGIVTKNIKIDLFPTKMSTIRLVVDASVENPHCEGRYQICAAKMLSK